MIQHPAFSVEPWCLRENELDLGVLAQSESLFAISNGHIGWRGNLDEGDPYGLYGSYLNGVHELKPVTYAEVGYGYPGQDQVMINVTDGKTIRLLVEDEPFDVRYGVLHRHERVLDFQVGTLQRCAEWSSPSDRRVHVTSTRLVSLVQRAIAAVRYEVEAVEHSVRVVVQSELITNQPSSAASSDPRASTAIEDPWRAVHRSSAGTRCELVHQTKRSELAMAVAMDHVVEGPPSTEVFAECEEDLGRVTIRVTLEPGERLSIVKFVAHGWSAHRSNLSLRDQVDAALVVASRTGWSGLLAEQRRFLTDYWDRADVEIKGDDEIQQAVRFSLFHVLQSGARGEGRGIPGKGLTGTGYDGHAFWDSETFVLRVLTYTMPEAVAHALSWRHDTLAFAKGRATVLGLVGAAFPWRTITGEACSAYWPAGTAAFHVNADIADAVIRYLHANEDWEFERRVALELLIETARLWYSLGCFDSSGEFRIDGVTGPDEYSAIADNNIYTNLMAQRNLRAASDVAQRHREASVTYGVDEAEIVAWRRAADKVVIPFDAGLGVHQQAEGFTDHQVWDFSATTAEQYPLFLHFPYFDLYRKQVLKQADLVLAMYLRGDVFDLEQKRVNFDYYESFTVRDSSLSACCQSVIAAEVGHMALAYDYLGEAALMDLDNLEHDTRDGLHIASLAGTWISLVAGFGGMREYDDTLRFAPRLPIGIARLAFGVEFRGRRVRVETTPTTTSYTLKRGDDLELFHFDQALLASTSGPIVFDTAVADAKGEPSPVPSQPWGRAPRPRVANSPFEQKGIS
ncbi:MAG TPA: glycosyl hydrolase family 65 protein [Acidimicrobiales bacterium]|nr:glycosyl hydrolase family 65 protein [Acidimicrobiales bacterium]